MTGHKRVKMRHIFLLLRNYEKSNFNIVMISLMLLLTTFSRGALLTYLPKYISGFVPNLTIVGLILSVPWVIMIFGDILIGRLSQKVCKKTLILVGMLILSLVGIVYFISNSPLVIMIGLLLYGIGVDLYFIPAYASLMIWSPKEKDSEMDAVYNSFGSLGWMLGPLVAGFIVASMLPKNVFLLFSMISLITFVFVLFVLKTPKEEDDEQPEFKQPTFKQSVKAIINLKDMHKHFKLSLFLSSFLYFWDNAYVTLAPLYVFSMDIDPKFAGLILTTYTLPFIIFRVPAGKIEDMNGKLRYLVPSLLLTATGFILFGFFENIFIMLALGFVITMGAAMMSPAAGGLQMDHTPKNKQSKTAFLKTVGMNIFAVCGYIISGIFATLYGFATAFLLIGIIIALVAGVVSMVIKDDLRRAA